jgi:hypothetical protein
MKHARLSLIWYRGLLQDLDTYMMTMVAEDVWPYEGLRVT